MPKPNKSFHIRYACWGLLPEHVLTLRPMWTEHQALEWLYENQQSIINAMTRVGWQVLSEVLAEESD